MIAHEFIAVSAQDSVKLEIKEWLPPYQMLFLSDLGFLLSWGGGVVTPRRAQSRTASGLPSLGLGLWVSRQSPAQYWGSDGFQHLALYCYGK